MRALTEICDLVTRSWWTRGLLLGIGLCLIMVGSASAADAPGADVQNELDVRELFRAGGIIGVVIMALSVAMVALIVEHALSLRRKTLMPDALSENVHALIQKNRFAEAESLCRDRSCFLSHVLGAGLTDVDLGYAAVEKSMEDASTEQAARLSRKIEYLSVIGTLAPMIGLLGTVWGMILAFHEFKSKADPQVAELAPGIYKALVTTLLGLGVAVPALGAFAIFRNRIDELVAEASLLAEHIFSDFKRSRKGRRQETGRIQEPAAADMPPHSGLAGAGSKRERGE